MARVGSWEIDVTSGELTVSEELARQLGVTKEEILAQGIEATIDRSVHPDDAERVRAALAAAVDGGPLDLELRLVRPDGSVVWVNNSVSVIRRPSGEPYGILAVTIDVTERRTAEAAVRENEARLRALTDNLDAPEDDTAVLVMRRTVEP